MQGEKMERIKQNSHVVGLKQSKKAIESGKATLVFIARDADGHVVFPLERMCEEKSVEIVYVNNMKELAKAARVDVPTAVVALVKNA
jgi:large subunit ribosomal protein L7A